MFRTMHYFGVSFLLGLVFLVPIHQASAHCDTMDGPVVQDAKKALDTNDITPVLKWGHSTNSPARSRVDAINGAGSY